MHTDNIRSPKHLDFHSWSQTAAQARNQAPQCDQVGHEANKTLNSWTNMLFWTCFLPFEVILIKLMYVWGLVLSDTRSQLSSVLHSVDDVKSGPQLQGVAAEDVIEVNSAHRSRPMFDWRSNWSDHFLLCTLYHLQMLHEAFQTPWSQTPTYRT